MVTREIEPELRFTLWIEAELADEAMLEARRVLDAIPMRRPCSITVRSTMDMPGTWLAEVEAPEGAWVPANN